MVVRLLLKWQDSKRVTTLVYERNTNKKKNTQRKSTQVFGMYTNTHNKGDTNICL